MSVNGQGLDVNYITASRMLTVCASHGHDLSQAYCYRVVRAMDFPEKQSVHRPWLTYQASRGSRAAMEELAELEPETAEDFKQKNRDWKGGVGGNFYSAYNMLHGMKLTDWLELFDDQPALKAKIVEFGDVAAIKVNRVWGDSLLHMAAACGKVDAVVALLTDYEDALQVDQRNDQTETPLYCACRAGQAAAAFVLLGYGADPTISKKRGETALHWLASFQPEYMEDVGQMLIDGGANISALTTEQISYTIFPPGLDIDHKPPGSPLLWAVHENRPDIVRFLLAQEDGLKLPFLAYGTQQDPLELSAYFHFHDCLKVMIDALDEARVAVVYSRLVWSAVQGGKRFSMMIRNGSKWKQRMTTTMLFLIDKAKNVVYTARGGGQNFTVLHEAIRSCVPDIVEVLLQQGLPMTEEFHTTRNRRPTTENETGPMVNELGLIRQKHINLARGEDRRSPLLEALHTNQKNVYDSLIQHGANPLQTARNPFSQDFMDWTALHVFANARPVYNLDLVSELIHAGVPVDGIVNDTTNGTFSCETPFMIAVANNAFQLATTLLEQGSDMNALTTTYGFTELQYPTTLLGHIAASSSRNSTARLHHLLQHHQNSSTQKITFQVEPTRNLTALHRIAMGPKEIYIRDPDTPPRHIPLSRSDYDFAANREICYELLQHFNTPKHINARESSSQKTALMLAVENDMSDVVRLLIDYGASTDLRDMTGRTCFDFVLKSAGVTDDDDDDGVIVDEIDKKNTNETRSSPREVKIMNREIKTARQQVRDTLLPTAPPESPVRFSDI